MTELSLTLNELSLEVIREEDEYSGIRVTLDGRLSRAAIRLHVDVNVGDPIWPEPQYVSLPRLLMVFCRCAVIRWKRCLPGRSQQRLPEAPPTRGGATL
jgi:hypothetical protein